MLAAFSLLPPDVGSASLKSMMDQPWLLLVLALISLVVLALIVLMYRKDSVELSAGITTTLIVLRICAFVALFAFFLNLEKRTILPLVHNSRALVMVDTSQSMSEPAADSSSTPSGQSRIEQVVAELSRGDLVESLRKKHDVVVYAFDEHPIPREVAAFTKVVNADSADSLSSSPQRLFEENRKKLYGVAVYAALVFGVSLAMGVLFLVLRGSRVAGPHASWALLASVLFLIASFVWLGWGCLNYSEATAVLLGITDQQSADDIPKDAESDEESSPTADDEQGEKEIDWQAALPPRGERTYLNDAIRNMVAISKQQDREGMSTVAAIVVFSDGGDNTEVDQSVAIGAANESKIPVYMVGLGTTQRPANVAVVDLQAPHRVLPGDDFTIQGLLRSYGMGGKTVKVELVSAAVQGNQQQADILEKEQRVQLLKDGEEVPVKFEVTPGDVGRRIYKLRVVLADQDHNPDDDEDSASVEIVERKNRILLMAGGPTREFRFLRNQLHRDKDTTVDVLLQTGQPGISQEADNLLLEFPKTTEELFEYDCVIAFDPDWQKLDEIQVGLLDRWVAEMAGGLIVVAGPVHTPQWSNRRRRDERFDTIKALYPVSFYSQGAATLRLGRFGGEAAWPLEFTRDGREAEFLWLSETALESEQGWSEFEGVYGYYAVKDPKPGARVYARFSDPDTSIDDELPIYLAGHFYGAGRVFFQASGEMWRVRAVDDTFFEQYYTKLIRWASEGRLLRDSSRGVLLVDKERCMPGDHVGVRAILTDSQHRPLTDDEVPAVLVSGRMRKPLILQKLKTGAREGMYAGQFTAIRPGKYTVELKIPSGGEGDLIARDVRVEARQLEIRNPQRQDKLMRQIATNTDGEYFVGVDVAMNRLGTGKAPIYDLIEGREYVEKSEDKIPDSKFQKVLMTWLLAFLSGVLCLEWVTRRLSKLA